MTAVHGPTFMLTDPGNYLVHLTLSPQTQHHLHTTLTEVAVTTAMKSLGELYRQYGYSIKKATLRSTRHVFLIIN